MVASRDRRAWFQGGGVRCLQPPSPVARAWRIVLLGPPGAGKGTQASMLSHALGACPLSLGEVFRAASVGAAAVGAPASNLRAAMARGELLPDAIVVQLLRERRRCLQCVGGFLLDGFPRTEPQALAFDTLLAGEGLRLDAVIYYDIEPKRLIDRLINRRVCTRCQQAYHLLTKRPRIEGVCDSCGGKLEHRGDDLPEAIAVRLAAYQQLTLPVLAHYRRQQLLLSVNADDPPISVFAHTLDGLSAM